MNKLILTALLLLFCIPASAQTPVNTDTFARELRLNALESYIEVNYCKGILTTSGKALCESGWNRNFSDKVYHIFYDYVQPEGIKQGDCILQQLEIMQSLDNNSTTVEDLKTIYPQHSDLIDDLDAVLNPVEESYE